MFGSRPVRSAVTTVLPSTASTVPRLRPAGQVEIAFEVPFGPEGRFGRGLSGPAGALVVTVPVKMGGGVGVGRDRVEDDRRCRHREGGERRGGVGFDALAGVGRAKAVVVGRAEGAGRAVRR